ncbi:MAG: NUDIX domain-containing protein [Mariprofundus sp.]|nr:NUDIX domain-containing protein [Mariprofundus sp.]
MLQQTQVKTVLPRYRQWFHTFPTIASLAEAPLDDVLKAWEGLGYYRRARFIHQSAIRITEIFSGHFPSDFNAILSLSGIGRSTAGAISSFCFDQRTPVLDGNVKRVLKRWHQKPEALEKQLWEWAQSAINQASHAANWNQAMMELGATHCSASKPECALCPVAPHCRAAFHVDILAEKKKPVAVQNLYWQVDMHRCPERGIWLIQRPDKGIWAGLWTPPIRELDKKPKQKPSHIHQLTHRRIHLYINLLTTLPTGHGQWVRDIRSLALPTGIHRLLTS